MPKAEKGTPKDIANRMKAKGLQKLKFYCQMCSRQMRDENGFKCHLTSESHLRQMKIFCSNSSGMLDSFSSDFEKSYLETLYRRHRTKRMNANNVYQELIQDKDHVHMNATKWTTLSDFVQYLGKSGKCVVEETERGWYVTYIERDPTILAQQENYKRRVEAEQREEAKLAKRMEVQRVEAAKLLDRAGASLHVEASTMERSEGDAPISLNLGAVKSKLDKKAKKKSIVFSDDFDDHDDEGNVEEQGSNEPIHRAITDERMSDAHRSETAIQAGNTRKRKGDILGKVEETKASKMTKDEPLEASSDELKDARKKNWIRKDILVRIITKNKKKYYKRKAVVNKVHDKFTAEVEILDSGPDADDGGAIVEYDQDDLETVIPKVGKKVIILNGIGRGMKAVLIANDDKKCRGKLELSDGTVLKKVEYDDFSKFMS